MNGGSNPASNPPPTTVQTLVLTSTHKPFAVLTITSQRPAVATSTSTSPPKAATTTTPSPLVNTDNTVVTVGNLKGQSHGAQIAKDGQIQGWDGRSFVGCYEGCTENYGGAALAV